MIAPLEGLVLGSTALLASFISGVSGVGFAIVLLPVLVLYVGIKEAFPIITIALLAAALSRVLAHRRVIAYPVVGWFTLCAVPATTAGALLFTVAAPPLLTRLLGLMMLCALVWRHWRLRPPMRRSAVWFLPVGAALGFLSGLTAGIGPLMAPFFLAYGLRKGSYVGTGGLVALCMQATKLAVFGQADFLSARVLTHGLLMIPLVIAGTLLGKRAMNLFSERFFERLIEGVMLFAGLAFLLRG